MQKQDAHARPLFLFKFSNQIMFLERCKYSENYNCKRHTTKIKLKCAVIGNLSSLAREIFFQSKKKGGITLLKKKRGSEKLLQSNSLQGEKGAVEMAGGSGFNGLFP